MYVVSGREMSKQTQEEKENKYVTNQIKPLLRGSQMEPVPSQRFNYELSETLTSQLLGRESGEKLQIWAITPLYF